MIIKEKWPVRFPVWALDLALSDDYSELTDDDIAEYRAWLGGWSDRATRQGCDLVIDIDIDATAYFSWTPDFGDVACECVDCTVLLIHRGGAQ